MPVSTRCMRRLEHERTLCRVADPQSLKNQLLAPRHPFPLRVLSTLISAVRTAIGFTLLKLTETRSNLPTKNMEGRVK